MTEEGPLASAPREIMKCANSTGAGRRLNDGDQGVRKDGLSEKEMEMSPAGDLFANRRFVSCCIAGRHGQPIIRPWSAAPPAASLPRARADGLGGHPSQNSKRKSGPRR
jgi:hypothetical protein